MKKVNTYNGIIMVVMIATLFMAILQKLPLHMENHFSSGKLLNISDYWEDEEGQKVNIIKLTNLVDADHDGKTSMYYTLPEDMEDTALLFMSSHINLDVYIGGKRIYHIKPQAISMTGKSYGTTFNKILIADEYAGKEIRIDVDCIYKDSAKILGVYLGSSGAYLSMYDREYLPSFIISILIILLSLLFDVFAMAIPLEPKLKNSLRAFAISSVLFGIWALGENHYLVLLFGNSELWKIFDYPILMFITYPFIVAVNGLTNHPRKIFYDLAFGLVGVTFVGTLLCFLFVGADYHETRYIIHGSLVVGIMIIMIILFWDLKESKGTKEAVSSASSRNFLLAGFLILGACIFLDLIRYYSADSLSMDSARYIRIGFLLVEVAMFYKYIVVVVHRMRTDGEMEMYRKLALHDVLTGLPNRAAYEIEEKELIKRIKEEENLLVMICSFDLNHLKKMNDTYGHAMGDEYIKEAAHILQSTFGLYGNVYRIGGDEYAAFLSGEHAFKDAMHAIDLMNESIEVLNNTKLLPKNLSIAAGLASCSSKGGMTFEQAEAIADERMYQDKSKIKKDQGYLL